MLKTKISNTIKLNPISLLISIFIFLLPVSFLLEMHTNLPLVSYWDEFITVLSAVYCLYLFMNNKLIPIKKITFMLFFLLILLGLLSNLSSKLTNNLFSIFLDIVALSKVIFPFIAAMQIAQDDKQKNIVKYLIPISKLFILSSFFFGTVNLFFDIGMNKSERFGIPSFYFIFDSEPYFGVAIAATLLIIFIAEQNNFKKLLYELFGIILMLYTTKGNIIIICVMYIAFLILWRKRYKISFINIVIISILVFLASLYQIENYLSDADTPRMLFIRYSLYTAIDYFPLGSGFSTFGSAEAAKQYSPLYYLYDFDQVWGLSPDYPMFLNDTYLPMILAQFGFIGMILFSGIFIMFFVIINNCYTTNKKAKALTISVFFALIIGGIGSAVIKMNVGVFAFIIMGLFVGYCGEQSLPKTKNKVSLKVK